MEVEPHSFLILTVVGTEWSSLCSSHFAPAETTPVSRNISNTALAEIITVSCLVCVCVCVCV